MVSETDRAILDHLLRVGNDAPTNIAEDVETAPEYVSQRLNELRREGLVENLGSGVWALTPTGVEWLRSRER